MTTSPCPARIETVIRYKITPDKKGKGYWITYEILPGLAINRYQYQHKTLINKRLNIYNKEIYC